jgi:hypothetical protein
MNDEDLRDLFAGMALQGMLAENGGGALHNRDLATTAYTIADAMIEAKYAVPTEETGIAAVVKRTRKRNETATKEGV